MITKFWRTEDGKTFECIIEAARHQQRIKLKAFLLESSVRDLAANSGENANIEFEGRLGLVRAWVLFPCSRHG